MGVSASVLPPTFTLLSVGSPSVHEDTSGIAVFPKTPECFLPTTEIVESSSRCQLEVESHAGETDSPTEEKTVK